MGSHSPGLWPPKDLSATNPTPLETEIAAYEFVWKETHKVQFLTGSTCVYRLTDEI